ncbi:MAG: glycosyltransferase, partial [Planctomycetota bacterium]
DCFLLGSVAINVDYPSRKSLPQLIEAFARFRRRHDDAVLYLHCSRGDEAWASGGINLPALVEQLGIIDSVRVAEGYDYLVGVPEEHMARVYSACDCLLCPSMGEGFGVPILEAQACGCPVIVGDWTSMSELCFEGYRIPSQESEPFWTALNAYQRLPRVDAIVDALEHMYERCQGDEAMRSRARESALRYDADLVAERSWGPTLLEIEGRLKDRSRRISRPLISRRDVPLHEFLLRTETNGFYENLVAPVTAWLDLCVILQLIRCYRPDSFLEVGTHLGHTSRAIAERFPELNIVTVDPGDKVPAARRPALQVDEYLAQERIGEVVAGFANVQVIKEEFANLEWSQGFDMVFLDGDHSYDQVLQDSRMALEILNDPGILIWHDFNHVPDVNRAIETLGLAQKIVSLKDTWIAFYDTCDRMALPVAELQEK